MTSQRNIRLGTVVQKIVSLEMPSDNKLFISVVISYAAMAKLLLEKRLTAEALRFVT
jgi:hypothetical protein